MLAESPETVPPDDAIVIVDVAWLRQNLHTPRVRVVDARPAHLYAGGHIPGAVNYDTYAFKLRGSDPKAIAEFTAILEGHLRKIGVQTDDRVIFYEDISGTSAARGVWLMDYAGLGGGALLDGGYDAWKADGNPSENGTVIPVPSDIRITPRPEILATADEILMHLAAPNSAMTLIDTRNAIEHQIGAIPGSVHLDWVIHLRPDGTLRPLPELRAIYDAAGVAPDHAIITYCASGFRAAHTYLILRALGYPRVRNYAPSWAEWGTRSDLPASVRRA
ncbi:MAG: rhodanese-like domain-containing protein [Chloroflexota bacterium]|nr:rhodanese-like domain-containing protein [Chloroflexota bacterium]